VKGALLLLGAGALLSLLIFAVDARNRSRPGGGAFRMAAPQRLLAALETQLPVYSWDAAKTRARLGNDLLVVDGRQGGRGARPKDSFRLPFGGATKAILPPDDREVRAVLVVAEAGRAAEARDLAQRLAREWALEEVATFKGGYEAWAEAGLPLQ
jgi:rhodanese-related sulfurtransferase